MFHVERAAPGCRPLTYGRKSIDVDLMCFRSRVSCGLQTSVTIISDSRIQTTTVDTISQLVLD